MAGPAIQDQMEGNHCYGCGTENPHGLQLKSFWDGDETVCRFQPASYHTAGPRHVLYGGTIASIIDCHSICSATAHAYRREDRAIGTGDKIWYVTGTLNIVYLEPTPIEGPVDLRARIGEHDERKTHVCCELSVDSQLCATANVMAIRVSPEWLREA